MTNIEIMVKHHERISKVTQKLKSNGGSIKVLGERTSQLEVEIS